MLITEEHKRRHDSEMISRARKAFYLDDVFTSLANNCYFDESRLEIQRIWRRKWYINEERD